MHLKTHVHLVIRASPHLALLKNTSRSAILCPKYNPAFVWDVPCASRHLPPQTNCTDIFASPIPLKHRPRKCILAFHATARSQRCLSLLPTVKLLTPPGLLVLFVGSNARLNMFLMIMSPQCIHPHSATAGYAMWRLAPKKGFTATTCSLQKMPTRNV